MATYSSPRGYMSPKKISSLKKSSSSSSSSGRSSSRSSGKNYSSPVGYVSPSKLGNSSTVSAPKSYGSSGGGSSSSRGSVPPLNDLIKRGLSAVFPKTSAIAQGISTVSKWFPGRGSSGGSSGGSVPPPMSGATINKTTAPSTPFSGSVPPVLGYGGANYNTATADIRKAMQENARRIQTDPVYRQSEINRTLDTIRNRQAQGLATDEQDRYLASLGGKPQQINTETQPVTEEPVSESEMTPEELAEYYRQIAEAEKARELAEQRRIADQQKDALTRAYERSNQILQTNRNMDNLWFERNYSPWSGQTDYAQGLVGRERVLADEAAQGNYNAAIAGIDQGLSEAENTAAQQVLARAYELEQEAKKYGLDFAKVFGQMPGGGLQTLDARNADRNYQLDLAGLTGYLPNGQMTVAGRNQALNETQIMAKLTGFLPDGTPTNEYQQQQLDNEWKVADAMGVITPALAKLYGIPANTPTQAAKEFAVQTAIQQQNANTAAYNAQTSRINANTRQQQQDSTKMNEELTGLANALRSGELTPTQALRQIDEDVQLGFYTPQEAQVLKQAVQTLARSTTPQASLTEEQLSTIPSDQAIEAEAKRLGYPILDYRSWYKSPQGRLAGNDFRTWQSLYGPRLQPR